MAETEAAPRLNVRNVVALKMTCDARGVPVWETEFTNRKGKDLLFVETLRLIAGPFGDRPA